MLTLNQEDEVKMSTFSSTKFSNFGQGTSYKNETATELRSTESESTVKSEQERVFWGTKADFLLSVIGYAVDLANIWRFPYLCYKNGGGVFLIPYVLMLVLGGIPLFYMELCLGQYQREGPISVWKICPLLKGVGYSACLIALYVAFYYNVIISWGLYYLLHSFQRDLPWRSCGHEWNSDNCTEDLINETANSSSILSSPAEEFFVRKVLSIHLSEGIDDLGPIKWDLAACLFIVFFILYFSLWKGVKMSGKVVWITATLPYIMLFILLIRGIMLPGSSDGIRFYLKPDLSKLFFAQVWIDAGVQIFFSLGVGFGVLIAFSSYNKFRNNCYLDAVCTSSVNCLTSFISGFVIFAFLGYMANKQNVDIDKVATEGPGLVFIVYPEAISTLPFSNLWAIIFFVMLLTLGLDSAMGGLESVITGISDDYITFLPKHRELLTLVIISLAFVVGLSNVTQGGCYIFTLFDSYAASTSILVTVLFEAIGVFWFYGVQQFCSDIQEMMGFTPSIVCRFVWKFVSPLFVAVIAIFSIVAYKPPTYETYEYPVYAHFFGWLLAMSSMGMIPIVGCYTLLKNEGTFSQKIAYSITPRKDHSSIERGKVHRFSLNHWSEI